MSSSQGSGECCALDSCVDFGAIYRMSFACLHCMLPHLSFFLMFFSVPIYSFIAMCQSSDSNLNVVRIQQFFANPKSDGCSETFTSDLDI